MISILLRKSKWIILSNVLIRALRIIVHSFHNAEPNQQPPINASPIR